MQRSLTVEIGVGKIQSHHIIKRKSAYMVPSKGNIRSSREQVCTHVANLVKNSAPAFGLISDPQVKEIP